MSSRSLTPAARLCFATLLSLSLVPALAGSASAEKILLKADGWEVFTDGRVAGFVSQVNGDGDPVGSPGTNVMTYPDGMMVRDTPQGGGWLAATSNGNTSANPPVQGTVNQTRIRSGFLGNQFNFGVRGQITPDTTVTGYISIWAFIESISQSKSSANPADVRQGYAKLEGPWGSFLAGRTRTLFSRGATDIDVLYAHKWGVGFPGSVDNTGPTAGQVGFGVMGSGFGAALIYGTPVLGGFHLNIGAFDPAVLSGSGLTRTGYPRGSRGDVRTDVWPQREDRSVRQRPVPERLQGWVLRSGDQRRSLRDDLVGRGLRRPVRAGARAHRCGPGLWNGPGIGLRAGEQPRGVRYSG